MKKSRIFLILLILMSSCQAATLPLNKLALPQDFSINVYAEKVPGARQMTLGNDGIVFVGAPRFGKVYALTPTVNFAHADKVIEIASGLNDPNGVAFKEGNLYVAEITTVLRFNDIEHHLSRPFRPEAIKSDLPNKHFHGWRYIKFGPDGWLYMGIGAPCNVCESNDPIFGTLVRMRSDGRDLQIFAKGIRNTVGFAWDPSTQKLWFTDNGVDGLGDNLPPDELNYAPHEGMHFGFPFFYGNNQPNPSFGHGKSTQGFIPAAYDLPAHVSPLGMVFYTGAMFPDKYKHQIIVAEHGSWDRSSKIGYRVSLITLKKNKPVSYQPFINGWLQGQQYWGRPVDVLVLPDGSLLISDDYAGVVYRVTYQAKK